MSTLPPRSKRLAAWLKQHRFALQTAALAGIIAPSFGLFWALNAGRDTAAVALFALVTAGMALTILTG